MTKPAATAIENRQAARLREMIRLLVRRFSLAERADIQCCGMTVAQAATLDALTDGSMRLGELGTRLGIAPSTLTRNLKRLEERGYVQRRRDAADGRAQRVALTAAGRQAAAGVVEQERQFARSVLAHLPHQTAEHSLEVLGELLAAIRTATESCCPGAYDHLHAQPERDLDHA
ncbi:MAG: MarR family winged helix-turn-helix transcriptional regulator [Holophagae bacterium]|jgi:DNA-binding MarR family transcriptional regulator